MGLTATARRMFRLAASIWRGAVLTLFLLTIGACNIDDLLSVDARSRIPAEIVETPENAPLLVNGAIADFECAFGAYVVMGALIGEELADNTQTASRWPYDRRAHQPSDITYATSECQNIGVYRPLQTARSAADNVLNRLEGWSDAQVPNRMTLIATAAAYAGYSYVLLAEGFCTMVVSGLDQNRNIVYGGEISRDSVFKLAEARFTRAIEAATAASNDNLLNMARVGRARARVALGKFADARADANLVPSGFLVNARAEASPDRRENRVWDNNGPQSEVTSVGDPYRTINDTRVPVTNTGRSGALGVPFWRQDKYPTAASPIPLATYEEAQLLVAEADIEAGTPTSFVNAVQIINASRVRGGQLGNFAGTTAATIRPELINQRRRELFLESQHLGDLIRFNITPVPAAGTTFPAGGNFGSEKCLPLPNIERENNPLLQT